jgi:hypothetical protein
MLILLYHPCFRQEKKRETANWTLKPQNKIHLSDVQEYAELFNNVI